MVMNLLVRDLELLVGQRDEVNLVSDISQDLVDADREGNQLALPGLQSKDKDQS